MKSNLDHHTYSNKGNNCIKQFWKSEKPHIITLPLPGKASTPAAYRNHLYKWENFLGAPPENPGNHHLGGWDHTTVLLKSSAGSSYSSDYCEALSCTQGLRETVKHVHKIHTLSNRYPFTK